MRAFIALLLVAAAYAAAPIHKVEEPIPGSYIIKLKDGIDTESIMSTVAISGGRISHVLGIINGFSAELTSTLLDMVSNLPGVEYIEEDGLMHAFAVGSWGLDRIDQRTNALDNSYTPTAPGGGKGTTVYVIDTGIRTTHRDFGGRASWGTNTQGDGKDYDCNGHGTHCAGTVGSNTYGVATEVNLVAVKVLGCWGSGSTSGVVAGVDWVRNNARKPAVASMSLGGGASRSMDTAVNNLVNSGVPTIVAAGNSNVDAGNTSPARAAQATCVGSSTKQDVRSSFSNYGPTLELFAPGSDITSTWHTSDFATNTISGTSMATPHVAGGVALHGSVDAMMNSVTTRAVAMNGENSPQKLLFV